MPVSVKEAIRRFNEAEAAKRGETLPDKFYPKPNRASIRAHRFGGYREGVGTGESFVLIRPNRSRIQRGKSRPGQRGVVLREGMDGAIQRYGLAWI